MTSDSSKNDSSKSSSVYPEATRGNFSSNSKPSNYGQQKQYKGSDPDKHMGFYFVAIIAIFVALFTWVIIQFTGVNILQLIFSGS